MLSAVVVNYRMAGFLPDLIAQLKAEGVEEIVVVDNPSSAEERARVAALDGVRTLMPDENRGYGAAMNAGVGTARGDVLLLMNPDMAVPPGALAPLTGALEGFEAAAPNLHWDRNGRWLLPHPQPHTRRADLILRSRPETALRQALAYQMRLWTGTEAVEVALVSGAALLLRRNAFEAVGGFDERYFLYFEENDFFERFRRAGFHAALVPRARFFHFHEPGRHPGQDDRYRASRELYERTWFSAADPKDLALPSTPEPLPLPPLDWDAPVPVEGRAVLYALSPYLFPCAAALGVEGTPTAGELLAGTPAQGGFLALAEGNTVRARFSLGVK